MLEGVIRTVVVVPAFASIDEAYDFHYYLVDTYSQLKTYMDMMAEVRVYVYTSDSYYIYIYILDTYTHKIEIYSFSRRTVVSGLWSVHLI